jgi:hypothetical protein
VCEVPIGIGVVEELGQTLGIRDYAVAAARLMVLSRCAQAARTP